MPICDLFPPRPRRRASPVNAAFSLRRGFVNVVVLAWLC